MTIKVLIVDDSIFTRMTLKEIFTEAGCEVIGEASLGGEAISKYRKLKPDIVTMNITMPEMNGIEATKKICNEDPNAKIIMCSAMGQKSLVIEAIQAGARDFIVKPFQKDRILYALKKIIGHKLSPVT